MGDNSKKWKSRLLSSSIPLEFEVAKILSELNFFVSYDYPYSRKDGVEQKEFSTDINASLYYPLDNENEIDGVLSILAECKYREEGKKWLFIPEINKVDFSTFTLGYTIRALKEFSKRRIKAEKLYEFEDKCDFSLKAVEVNTITGDVFDKDIRHGVYQLKFALPYLVKDFIEGNLYGHIEDVETRFIVPVLITNADLYLIKENFSISQLKEIDNVEDISTKVPYIILYSDIGPDFTEHHKVIFKDFFKENKGNRNLTVIEALQKKFKYGKFRFSYSAMDSCFDLQESFKSKLLANYSQFFVCSFQEFPGFINGLIKAVEASLKKRN